ncbi:hypothetical protein TTHERM_00035050 (macronuclear) [Tetrahymena thermophila SB210]|uniref:Sin1 middle CRIM domain-containing protein n=1 Tax=Tetrahymena thermophila (strain SB210) TaxID=312017 RepID=Q22ML4_TETTS|nr:hypothetical protein TTHERM_00035050 [Tetrahymena thermophila SB210]EAR86647.2 hypothetical protein TTHERM_00035050 [Tetrahymena thermophila SB210]|eukprot:XP_977006.2 hypothetical protein TTHERM_00035050 [Tetrahymena thermophila SB210]
MDSLPLENISNYSWDKEGFQDEISFESVNLVPKKHISALKSAKFYSNKIYNIFLLFTHNQTQKSFHQVSIKLPLQITINEAMYQIFAAFETLLNKNNAPFSIIEDSHLWQMRIAKKTGFPKDYIPAIDQNNLMKSVECYDNLVLCPIKESECIRITSSSTICSKDTKHCTEATNSPTSAADSNSYGSLSSDNNNLTSKIGMKIPKIQQDGKVQAKKTQLSSFDKDYNNSTTCSDNKNFKNGISSNYSSRAFYSKDEEDDVDIFTQQKNQRVSKQNKEEIALMKKNKKKSFFSFLCC